VYELLTEHVVRIEEEKYIQNLKPAIEKVRDLFGKTGIEWI
jgi:hypothetical protein